MQGVDKIVSEIKSQAEKKANEIIYEANLQREIKLKEVQSRLELEKSRIHSMMSEEREDAIRRRMALSGPEIRMMELGEKRRLIDSAYEEAYKILRKATESEYCKLFERLLSSCAEDGEISVAATDASRFNEAWVEKVSKLTGKKMKLNGETFKSRGGLILHGKSVDVDLTLETLMEEVRQESERKITALLFEE